MSAGEHLSDEVFALWKERFGLDIYEAVGMSECSYYLSQNRMPPIRPGSAGFPQPATMSPARYRYAPGVAAGEEGMICIPKATRASSCATGTCPRRRRSAAQRLVLHRRLRAVRRDGYLWFLGRKDDIIKSFGYRVSPYEVERVLKGHPAVADCACVAEDAGPDKRLVVAYVISQEGSAVTPGELLAYGLTHLAAYKAPKVVYLARRIPAHSQRQDPAAGDHPADRDRPVGGMKTLEMRAVAAKLKTLEDHGSSPVWKMSHGGGPGIAGRRSAVPGQGSGTPGTPGHRP
jgi:acyl-coenzyme A synthetase/AMP-(fatty) acid ligase